MAPGCCGRSGARPGARGNGEHGCWCQLGGQGDGREGGAAAAWLPFLRKEQHVWEVALQKEYVQD